MVEQKTLDVSQPCEAMTINAIGSVGWILIMWNLNQVIFKDWIDSRFTLSGIFWLIGCES